jgi:antitoxin VapB
MSKPDMSDPHRAIDELPSRFKGPGGASAASERRGRNQVVRISVKFELPGDQAVIHRNGDRLVIEPVRKRGLLALLKTMKPLDEDFPEIADSAPRFETERQLAGEYLFESLWSNSGMCLGRIVSSFHQGICFQIVFARCICRAAGSKGLQHVPVSVAHCFLRDVPGAGCPGEKG